MQHNHMTIFLASIAYNNNVSLPDCGLPIVSLIMKSVHSETKFVKICLTHTLFCAWGINCWFVIPPTGCKMWLFGAKSGPCTNDCVGVEQNGIWKKKTTTASLNYSRCSRTPTNKFGLYSSTSDYTVSQALLPDENPLTPHFLYVSFQQHHRQP